MNKNQIEQINFEAEILNIETHSTILDEFVLKIRGRLVVADTMTLNKTIFPLDELKLKYKSIEYMPLNLNHKQDEILGTITQSELIYPEKNKPEVWIYGYVWDFLKPHIGDQIIKSKKLNLSVEVYSESVECPECGHTIPYLSWKSGVDLCEHWKRQDNRIFKGFLFLGCALLLPPQKPAVPNAEAELYKLDFTKITPDNIKKLSDEELLKLHKELHDEFRKAFERAN